MSSRRRGRATLRRQGPDQRAPRRIACGPGARELDESAVGPGASAPVHVFETPDGSRWLATLVARIACEDERNRTATARLIVRVESLDEPGTPPRTASVAAQALHEVDEDVLAAIALRPPAHRTRRTLSPRLGRTRR